METTVKTSFLKNPFTRIAGWQALLFGIGGLIVVIFVRSLQFIPDFSFVFYDPRFIALEIATVLEISTIFFILGRLFSRSSIPVRYIDVLGTVAFALLPFLVVNLQTLLKSMTPIVHYDSYLTKAIWIAITLVALFISSVWSLYWLFQALRTSTNLKGRQLVLTYITGVIVPFIVFNLFNAHIMDSIRRAYG